MRYRQSEKFYERTIRALKNRKFPLILTSILILVTGLFVATSIIYSSRQPEILFFDSGVIDTLPPHMHIFGDESSTHQMVISKSFTIPEDVWVIGSEGEVINASFRVLHHSVLVDGSKKSSECFPSGITGRSRTFTFEQKYPEGYGTFVKKGTKLSLISTFHNDTNETFRNVSFVMKVHVIPARRSSMEMKPMLTYPLIFADKPCNIEFDIPANATGYIRESRDGDNPPTVAVIPEDGDIIMLHSHFHPYDGAKRLSVFVNGEELFTFFPVPPSASDKNWYIPFIKGSPVIRSVKKGDKVTYAVEYDNPKPTVYKGAMGILYVYFSPKHP